MSQQVRGMKAVGRTLCAGMLGTAVCLWASVATAGPLTCSGGDDILFPGSAERCETIARTFTPTTTSRSYFFDSGFFSDTLSFDAVLVPEMTVFISAFFVIPGNPVFDARVPSTYEPELFLTSTGPRWIYFRVEDLQDDPDSGPPLQGVHFSGDWVQDIVWLGDGSYHKPEVLHDDRPLNAENGFSDVITIPGSFDPTPGCGEICIDTVFTDPAIGGIARDFSDTTVVSTVPEPSSLLLLGAGLSGFLYRRRQRAAARRTESL